MLPPCCNIIVTMAAVSINKLAAEAQAQGLTCIPCVILSVTPGLMLLCYCGPISRTVHDPKLTLGTLSRKQEVYILTYSTY